jgi:tetratricopeptide (TPR) repeat protein
LNDGYFKKARAEFENALALAEDAKHNLAIVDAREHLALVLSHFEGDFQRAKELLLSCLEILGGTDDDNERAEVLERLARVYEDEGDSDLSENVLRQSLAISQRLGDKQAQAGTLVGLAWTLGRAGKTDEAFDINQKAYDLLIQVLHGMKSKDKRQLTFIHTVLGNLFFQRAKIYQRKAEPDEAERSLETAIQWQRKNPPNHELAKLTKELAELKVFKRDLNAGIRLLHEAATLYQEREMLPDFAECLHTIGRIYASVEDLDQAKKLFSAAASVAIQGGRNQRAAEILLSLGHLAMEQKEFEQAQELFEFARSTSEDGLFQAECLMDQGHLAAKQGRKEDWNRLAESAVDLLRKHILLTQPELERARTYFRLGQYLRELERLEEALSCIRKACDRFNAAHDTYGVAKSSFETAGLLDQMGRKLEARQECVNVLKLVEGKPFFEIAAAVDFSLANFALHDDKDLDEARRFVEHGIKLCKDHDLPLLPQMMLLQDELETTKRAGAGGSASLPDLLDSLHEQLALCPTNREGGVRFWAFSHAIELTGALRATLGPNVAVFATDLRDFLDVSAQLKPYREWSLVVSSEQYPDDIGEIIPFAEKMLYSPESVAFLGIPKEMGKLDPETFWKKTFTSPEIRAQFSASRVSSGGTIPRYYFVSLEGYGEKFGGARAGVWGNSLELPPVVHELLQEAKDELKTNRLFFVYYNRGRVEDTKKLWYDLAIFHRFHCLTVYRGELPTSKEVRVVASCPLSFPRLDDSHTAQYKRSLRNVQKALLELFKVPEGDAASKLYDLTELMENLANEVHCAGPHIQTILYVLSFNYEGKPMTHPALVVR